MARKMKFLYDGETTRCFHCKERFYSTEDMMAHRCELEPKENSLAGNQQDDEFPPPDPDQQV